MSEFLLVIFILLAILIGLSIHELGHFVFARIFKVNVKEFAIGIGPRIYSHQFKTIRFSINLLPIMAFVRIDSERSLRLFGQLRDEYQKEADEYYQKNEKYITAKNKYIFVKKNSKLVKESTIGAKFKYNQYLKKISKYTNFATRVENRLIMEDVSKIKQLIIYFGGIFFNLILFAIFYLIQYFGLQNQANPFIQIGDAFLTIFKNMVFYNAWAPEGSKTAGTAFGSVAEIANKGGIQLSQLPLVCVNYFAIFNLMLFLFNFIPIPPLDGYKIVCTLSQGYGKIRLSEKVKSIFEFGGLLLMLYILVTSILADFLM